MWYTKNNLRIAQAQPDKLTQFKNWLKDIAPLFSNYIKAVSDDFDIKNFNKEFQYTLTDDSTHIQSLDEISKTGIRLTRVNKDNILQKADPGEAPKAGNVSGYVDSDKGYSYTQELNTNKTEFVQPASNNNNNNNNNNKVAYEMLLKDLDTLKKAIPKIGNYAVIPLENKLRIQFDKTDNQSIFEGTLSEIINKVLANDKYKSRVVNRNPTQEFNPAILASQQQVKTQPAPPSEKLPLDILSRVKENSGQQNKQLELLSPKSSNNTFEWDFGDEYVEDYNKLVDFNFKFIANIIPDSSQKGYTVQVESGQVPAGVDAKFIEYSKNYIIDNAVFKLATDETGQFKPSIYEINMVRKTAITPSRFQKTFIEPLLPGVGIGDPIKLKIDGRDIKGVRNGERVILDPNDLYLTQGKHIIEFVSNNADQNANPDKLDFLSYQVNVIDGQKLSLIGSARGSFPNLYNRAPPSTEQQRIEEKLKAQRKAPTQEPPEQTDKLDTALRAEAISFGLQNKVYNTAMQRYDFNEVQQYVEEIMRNRALYSTPQKRKEYADSLKRERGRVRTQTPADALLNPRSGA